MIHDVSSDANGRSRRRPLKLAVALTALALAVPAAAAAYPITEPASYPGQDAGQPSSQPVGSSLNSITGPLPHGIQGPVALVRGHNSTGAELPDSAFATSQSPASPRSGFITTDAGGSTFDWGDAAIGAGVALALAALAGAGLTLRRRETLATRPVASQG